MWSSGGSGVRAGVHRRTARQQEWDAKDGEGNREVGCVLQGEFVPQTQALESIYSRSYEEHFAAHPEDLDELVRTARRLRNPHAEATTGVDLQVPAITTYLERDELALRGEEVVDIGSWRAGPRTRSASGSAR